MWAEAHFYDNTVGISQYPVQEEWKLKMNKRNKRLRYDTNVDCLIFLKKQF